METFSVGALVRTWFSPYKQTFSGSAKGSIGMLLRAFVDSLISRVIGFLVRTILIFTGLVCAIFSLASGLLLLVLWAVIPLALPASLIMIVMGVGK